MSEVNKNVVITKAARQKLVRARAGDLSLPKIVGMAFGDGGVDSDGTVIPPTEAQTELTNELLRKAITGHEYPEGTDTTCRYTAELSENELVGKEISEIALYDETGDIVCIKTFSRKGKDDDMKHIYTLDDIF